MIQIQRLKDKTLEQAIEDFQLNEQTLLRGRLTDETSKSHFVVCEGDRLLGICQFDFIDNSTAIVDCIYISPSERKMKLGDGLLRAILNSIEIRGGSSVIFIANEEEQLFYKHAGFEVLDDSKITSIPVLDKVDKLSFDNGLMQLKSISEFFNQPCKSSLKK
ncbi:GNAT family N-acetyltransferase [Fusibacter bizertensis]